MKDYDRQVKNQSAASLQQAKGVGTRAVKVPPVVLQPLAEPPPLSEPVVLKKNNHRDTLPS